MQVVWLLLKSKGVMRRFWWLWAGLFLCSHFGRWAWCKVSQRDHVVSLGMPKGSKKQWGACRDVKPKYKSEFYVIMVTPFPLTLHVTILFSSPWFKTVKLMFWHILQWLFRISYFWPEFRVWPMLRSKAGLRLQLPKTHYGEGAWLVSESLALQL